jgi:hypothetical protein
VSSLQWKPKRINDMMSRKFVSDMLTSIENRKLKEVAKLFYDNNHSFKMKFRRDVDPDGAAPVFYETVCNDIMAHSAGCWFLREDDMNTIKKELRKLKMEGCRLLESGL